MCKLLVSTCVDSGRQEAHENAHELAAGGTESKSEMSEPPATSSKGHERDDSRWRRLGSHDFERESMQAQKIKT